MTNNIRFWTTLNLILIGLLYLGSQLALMPRLSFGDERYFLAQSLATGRDIFTQPLWFYGPLMPLLLHPLTALTTPQTAWLLRVVPLCLSAGTLYMLYRITAKYAGTVAILGAFPLIALTSLWAGAMWYYWDAFMWFFFALTLYLTEFPTRYKCLPYVTAFLMLNAKIVVAPLLLVPLIVRNRRMMWLIVPCAGLVLAIGIQRHDLLYVVTYSKGVENWLQWTTERIGLHALAYLQYVLLTVPIVLAWRRYRTCVAFYAVTLVYPAVAAFGMSHTAGLLYSGIMAFPLFLRFMFPKFELFKEAKHGQVLQSA